MKWDQRFKRYLDYNFFEHQIHWFSICNSFMMVIFLTGAHARTPPRLLAHARAPPRRPPAARRTSCASP